MNSAANIPFLDLVTPHVELEKEFNAIFKQALESAAFIGGPAIEGFEREFASFCEVDFCAAVSSGTSALHYALVAAGVLPGDSVITVANTFIATAEAITQSGALPEFVDVEEATYNMDPARLLQYLEEECDADPHTGRRVSKRSGRPVTAVIPVHLYGQMADMDAIIEIAEKYNLIVVEDACQAHGAQYFSRKQNVWKTAGSMGKAAAFSFYPGKNLGACGDGGAVTSNEEEVIRKIKMIRDHGQAKKYYHDMEGDNGRLDSIQAGFLRVKLQHLAKWNEQRRACAALYNETLASLSPSLILPAEGSSSRAVYHLYVVRNRCRMDLQAHLSEKGVATAIHYPIPLHLQKAYQHLKYSAGDLPVTERVSAEILSLPMFPHLQPQQQKRVAGAISAFVQQERRQLAMSAAAGD
jgi:dTDP-4-amino-4,6-dideoxygalactose transaminase